MQFKKADIKGIEKKQFLFLTISIIEKLHLSSLLNEKKKIKNSCVLIENECFNGFTTVRSAYKNKDNKREYEIKSNKIKTTISINDNLNDQLIQGFAIPFINC